MNCHHKTHVHEMAVSETRSQWLRKRYREAPADGPDRKTVKFSDVEEALSLANEISGNELAQLVKEVFPNSVRKQLGGNRHSYFCGIEPIPGEYIPDEDSPTLQLLEAEREHNQELMAQNNSLLEENAFLKRKVAELEQLQSLSVPKLELEMDCLLNPRNDVYHGPSSIQHFEAFSVDKIIAEIRQQAPDIFRLLSQPVHMSSIMMMKRSCSQTSDVSVHTFERQVDQSGRSAAFADLHAHCKSHV